LLQESLASFIVNERSAFRITPSVQLDRKMAVIDGELKRWRIPHFFSDRTHIPFSSRIVKLSVGNALLKVSGRRLRRPTDLNALAPNFFGTRGGTEKKGAKKVQAIPERQSGTFSKRALTYCKRSSVCQPVFRGEQPKAWSYKPGRSRLIAEISA
jgi:hypothetical protein